MYDKNNKNARQTHNSDPEVTLQQAKAAFGRGLQYYAFGHYHQAAAMFNHALSLYQTLEGTEDDQAGCLKNLGSAQFALGMYANAAEAYTHALTLYQTLPGTEAIQARALNDLGLSLHRLGEHSQAIDTYAQALALHANLSNNEADHAGCLVNFGVALDKLGNYADAADAYTHALALHANLSNNEADHAGCLVNFGVALDKLGNYADAAEAFTHALTLYQTLPGTEHNQAECHYNHGILLGKLGNYADAAEAYTHALTLYQTLPGTEHNQANCHNRLSSLFTYLGQFDKAQYYQAQTHHIARLQPDTDHNEHFDSLFNRAYLIAARGDYAEALNTYKAGVARLNIDQANPELHAKTLYLLGALHALQGRHDEARSNLNNALTILKTLNQWEGVIITLTQLALFSDLQVGGERDEPRTFLKQAKSLLVHTPSPLARQSYLLANALVNLRSLYHQEQLSRDLLDETMEAALTIALEADEQRFIFDHTDERQQWINSTADSIMEISFEIATFLDKADLIAELVAKWRLSGTIEGRASETRIFVPPQHSTNDQVRDEGNDPTRHTSCDRAGHSVRSSAVEAPPSQPHSFDLASLALLAGESLDLGLNVVNSGFSTPEHVTTRRTPGPLLHMPYGHRCELAEHIPDADTRTHARYR